MPDAPTPIPTNAAAPDPRPVKSATLAERPQAPLPAGRPILAITLGALAVVLLIVAFEFWSEVGDRDQTIAQNQNRLVQVQAEVLALQTQVGDANKATVLIQARMDRAKTESDRHQTDLDKVKASDVDLQTDLDKARVNSTAFQTQMEDAKVASLKHEGEVEVAEAKTSVAQTELDEAKADKANLERCSTSPRPRSRTSRRSSRPPRS